MIIKNPWYLGLVPVNTTNAEYDENLAAWTRARRVMAGEDAVKAASEAFLPRLELQTDAEFPVTLPFGWSTKAQKPRCHASAPPKRGPQKNGFQRISL